MFAGISQTTSIDYFCLKCSLILVEPVLLPCNHRFCLICINDTIKSNSLCCPFCLKRFGSWLRLKNVSNSKNNLVDEGLWNTIKKRFNDLLQKRPQETITKSIKAFTADDNHLTAQQEVDVTKGCKLNWTPIKSVSMSGERETDSINIEMTHFRPIRLMPISTRNSSCNILKIPPIRLKSPKQDALSKFKPARSKFKQKLTSVHRRSAFYVVSPPPPPPPPPKTLASNNVTKSKANAKINNVSAKIEKQNISHASPKIKRARKTKATKKKIQNQNHYTKNGQHKNDLKLKHIADELNNTKLLKLRRTRNEQTILQEKADYQLAKLLQNYEDNNHSVLSNGSLRYSLRSRGKMSSLSDNCIGNGNGLSRQKFEYSATSSESSETPLIESGIQKKGRGRRLAVTTADILVVDASATTATTRSRKTRIRYRE